MNRKAFFIIVSTMFISMIGMGIVTPFLPSFAHDLGATTLEVGIIQASFSLSGIPTLLFIGRLSDRYGRKLFLCIGLGILTASSIGFLFVHNPMQVIIVRLFQGLGASAHYPIAQAYLGDITPEGEEARWMGYFNAILFAGIGAGPLLGGVLTDAFSMTTTFQVMGIASGLGLVLTIIFLQEAQRKTAPQGQSSSLAPFKSRFIRGAFAYRIAVGFSTSVMMAFLPLYADVKIGLSAMLIGVLMAMRSPVSLFQSYSGRLSDRYGRRKFVILGSIISIVAVALIPSIRHFWPLLVANFFLTLGQATGLPAATAYVVQEGRYYGMGACMTIFNLAMQLGNGTGPIILGALGDAFGLESVFYAATVLMLLGLLMFLWFVRAKPSTAPHY